MDFKGFSGFLQLVHALRAPGGCPWDRAQTHRTLAPYVLEEAYEVVDAIEQEDPEKLKEELGDLLLQVVLHAELAQESDHFSIGEVVEGIIQKMVMRHPHVFGEVVLEGEQAVVDQWERLKAKEREAKGNEEGVETSVQVQLDLIPKSLPALARAQKIQARVARVGFDWETTEGAWEKVKEEVAEVEVAFSPHVDKSHIDKSMLRQELGDLLFSVVNVIRKESFDAETLLREANKKFMRRFSELELRSKKTQKRLEELTVDELNQIWEELKEEEVV